MQRQIDGHPILFKSILGFMMCLRPKQWTKNLLVFAALIFSIKKINVEQIYNSIFVFFLFCFVAGCVYIINDFADREQDKLHPDKRNRPIASGLINPYVALLVGAVLLVFSVGTSYVINPLLSFLLLFYFIMNVGYSFKLKHVVVIDIMIIATGFVLRAIAGGLAIQVPFTPWFLLCTMLLALFLAISKRRHELYLLKNNKSAHRKVLEFYSPELLNQLNGIVTTAAIISYALFTFTSGHTIHLMWTIPCVIYGIFRYLYLIHMEEKGGKPEKVLLEDKHILITVIVYGLMTVTILSYFE